MNERTNEQINERTNERTNERSRVGRSCMWPLLRPYSSTLLPFTPYGLSNQTWRGGYVGCLDRGPFCVFTKVWFYHLCLIHGIRTAPTVFIRTVDPRAHTVTHGDGPPPPPAAAPSANREPGQTACASEVPFARDNIQQSVRLRSIVHYSILLLVTSHSINQSLVSELTCSLLL